MIPEHLNVVKHAEKYKTSDRITAFILIASVSYLSALSFINARGIHISSGIVALVELGIFSIAIFIQRKSISLLALSFAVSVITWMFFTWLIRQSFDFKSLRDFLIPLIFINLGVFNGNEEFADKFLKITTWTLVGIGIFETVFLSTYAEIFNTFSFYAGIGSISESNAMFSGQMLTLNGYRPDGIGRTLFPSLLGSHRASSLLMEPVSLGNFAIIILSWELRKSWKAIQNSPYLLVAVAASIILSDSRFGLVMAAALICFRLLANSIKSTVAPVVPFAVLGLILVTTLYLPSTDDTFAGRISKTGTELINFDWSLLLGLSGPLPNFGDMGYAHILSRYGAPLCIIFLATLFLIPMKDQHGERFRASIVVYISSILAISGTSIFALKTAAIMWFAFGVLIKNKSSNYKL